MLRRLGLTALSLVVACLVWLPALRLLHGRADDAPTPAGPVSSRARAMAARAARLWRDPALREVEVARMRAGNAEWDFMGRTFLALALANVALREPARQAECLAVIDAILDETLRLEAERGQLHFLLPYARHDRFRNRPQRSLFVDGEVLLMAAARRLVEEKPDLRPVVAERARHVVSLLEDGPVLCGESYPDECWTFCNAAALAGLRLGDAADGTDHRALCARWVARARERLCEPASGLLVSSFHHDGRVKDGPEGSTIWFAIHALWLVDEPFAREQWARARADLGRDALGFGWAREWGAGWTGPMDIDSGPIVPVLEASASSSGLALLAAATAGDEAWLRALLRSLDLGGAPVTTDGPDGPELHHAAGNQVGDAVVLYALVQGPLWARANERLR